MAKITINLKSAGNYIALISRRFFIKSMLITLLQSPEPFFNN